MHQQLVLVTLATALLTACGGARPQVTTSAAHPARPPSGTGQLQNYSAGAGHSYFLARNSFTREYEAVTRGTLSADGTFDVALPTAAGISPYLTPANHSCWGQSNPHASTASVIPGYQAPTATGTIIEATRDPFDAAPNPITLISHTYASADTTVTGDCNGMSASLTLKAGWNVVAMDQTYPDGTNSAAKLRNYAGETTSFYADTRGY